MAVIDSTSPTLQALWAHYESQPERPGNRIGVSWLGKECPRALWYSYRWAAREKFSGRMRRLFQTGHLEELRVYADLLCIGLTVAPGPGFQLSLPPDQRTHEHARRALQAFVDAGGPQFALEHPSGHIGGYADGACLGVLEAPETWHMLEIKTHSAKSFADLSARGVQLAKPQHYVQVQAGMRMLGLERCLYIAVNKDNDDIHMERIRLERAFADLVIQRGVDAAFSPEPPERITSAKPDAPPCKWCPFAAFCFNVMEAAPAVSCRSCAWAVPEDAKGQLHDENGKPISWWSCRKHHKPLEIADQVAACDSHLYIPGMLPGHQLLEATEDHVEYACTSQGAVWRNGKGPRCITSRDMEVNGWLPF
jgi:hypothetical protein